jgi:hypothetical protein
MYGPISTIGGHCTYCVSSSLDADGILLRNQFFWKYTMEVIFSLSFYDLLMFLVQHQEKFPATPLAFCIRKFVQVTQLIFWIKKFSQLTPLALRIKRFRQVTPH